MLPILPMPPPPMLLLVLLLVLVVVVVVVVMVVKPGVFTVFCVFQLTCPPTA